MFASFWPDFQQFNIMRTKRINEVMGHPLDGQIIQIVCWHHFLASVHEQEKQISTYDECFDAWHHALEPEHIDVEVKKSLPSVLFRLRLACHLRRYVGAYRI